MPHLIAPLLSARLLLAMLALPAAACAAGVGHAQAVDTPPVVVISPGSMATSQTAVPVTVTFSDDLGLADSTFHVYVDGVDVRSSFAYAASYRAGHPRPYQATASGVVQIGASGAASVSARICDNAAQRQCSVNGSPVVYTVRRPGVAVAPDREVVAVAAGARSQSFVVRNTGTEAAAFALRAVCRNAQTWVAVVCSAPAATASVAAGGTATVQVSYTAAAGDELVVSLTARLAGAPGVEDAGWADVTASGAVGTTLAAPQVSPVTLQSGARNDRGDCVTVATAARGAYECGDLRVVHGLPAHRTRGRTWAPALLYNSQQAHPRPTVYADVTMPAGSATPAYVEVVVAITGGVGYSAHFDGGSFAPGATRRIGVQWDGLSTPTGVYGYTLQVTAVHAGGVRAPAPPATAEIAIVNRSGSPFGAGWWWAGWERIICVTCGTPGAPPRMLWIGGDGSTQLFEPLQTWASWTAQNPAGPPDTLYLVNEGGANFYRRRLRGGGEINLDGNGWHFRTINRLGQVTAFDYANGMLNGVYVPNTGNGVAPAWILTHLNGQLQSLYVGAQGAEPRSVVLNRSGVRVLGIQDTDGIGVTFEYDGQAPYRIAGQTDRRGTRTTYTYDAAGRLDTARLWMGTVRNDSVDVVTVFDPAESRGVTGVGTNGYSVARAHAYTRMDGPRTDVADVTQLHLDRRGLVRRVVNALGQTTVANRTNTSFPALVTETVGPGGRQVAEYDARGRVHAITEVNPLGDSIDRTVIYAYDDRWDRPDTIRSPLVGETRMAYDPVTGNVLWQEVGDITRRTWFDYHTSGPLAGQLARVRHPDPVTGAPGGGGADSLAYDSIGNLRMTRSPMGFLTLHYCDGLGRDTLTVTPTDSTGARSVAGLLATGVRQRTAYDVMDRVRQTEAVGPALTHARNPQSGWQPRSSPQERLFVRSTYDGEGQPLTVERWGQPDSAGIGVVSTTYAYDQAGRRTYESTTDFDGFQAFAHDQAGNVIRWTSGRGYVITAEYDALGRMVKRSVPEVREVASGCIPVFLTPCDWRFPLFPNEGNRLLIPREQTYFRYDSAGSQVYAENGDAVVQRSYYPGGALRTDTVRMRTYRGADFTRHVYGLEYRYDVAGRPDSIRHPLNLAGSAAWDLYAYHPVTGAADSIVDRRGLRFRFGYDLLGRPVRMDLPGGVVEATEYDLDGRRTLRDITRGSATVLHETLRYDGRGKVMAADNVGSLYTQAYTGLGSLTATDWANVYDAARNREESVTDPLGNVVRRRAYRDQRDAKDPDEWIQRYSPGSTGVRRVAAVWPEIFVDGFRADSSEQVRDFSGNLAVDREWGWGLQFNGTTGITREAEARHWYAADEKLRVVQRYDDFWDGGTYRRTGVWEEYRYDPLGRRILVRTRRDGDLCNQGPNVCASTITRFVWSGDDLLWELKAAGGEENDLEATTGAGLTLGMVSYTHGGGIDRPLALHKEGYRSLVPHETWRGQFTDGTCVANGGADCGVVPWPGWRTTAYHAMVTPPDTENWRGGLVDGMRDATGQMYRRNRYYDPQTGQFTQPDPIGLAGGLNSYGFAEGDPVTYSDPYGLEPDTLRPVNKAAADALAAIVVLAGLAMQSEDASVARSGRETLRLINDLHTSSTNVFFMVAPDQGRSSTGPMNDGSGVGSYVNVNQSTKRVLPVRGAHELGHAWAIVMLGATDPSDSSHRRIQYRESLRFENHMRNIYGCTSRAVHGTDSRYQNPPCRP